MNAQLIAILAVSLLCAPPMALPSLNGSPSPTARAAPQDNFTLQGKITTLAPGKVTVSTEENIIFHVSYDDKTEIKRKDGTPGSGRDLEVGQTIAVAGNLEESGVIAAKTIKIQ